MIRRTLGSVRSYLARSTESGMCPDDDNFATRINEAQERLLNKGKWPGSKVRYSICVYDSCITLPRELESILAINIDSSPVQVRNEWFEFLEAGPGTMPPGGDGITPIDRGTSVLFRDICGTKKIWAVTDRTEVEGAGLWIKGYGPDGKRVRTTYVNGSSVSEEVDGEWLSLSGNMPAETVNTFVEIDSVIKTKTNGFVHLYQVDPDTEESSAIGLFHPLEELPLYRRYEIPNQQGYHTLTILAKKRFIPAVDDNDDLMITNLGALKMMLRAIEKEENNLLEEAVAYETRASVLLSEEYREYLGGVDHRQKLQVKGFAPGTLVAMM